MWKKNLSAYLISCVIVAVIIIHIYDNALYILFSRTNLFTYLIASLIALVLYILTGIQYYLVRKEYCIELSKFDIVFFPIVMNLWSILLPIQGSLLFSTLFFKFKYKMRISESVSINLYIYLISASFTGIIGFLFLLTYQQFNIFFILICFILTFNPIIIFYLSRYVTRYKSNHKYLIRLQFFFASLFQNNRELWSKKRFALLNFSINILRSFIMSVWYYWIAINMGINISYLALLVLSMVMQLTVIIKLTPDNIGIAQFISGSLTSSMGLDFSVGLVITLYATLSTLLIVITLGLYGNFKYMQHFNIKNIYTLMKNVKNINASDDIIKTT
jgi:hypothetical protein